jgi:putative FmdB family regulatory protein
MHMPTYTYKCANCDNEIELYRSYDSPQFDWMSLVCPVCNQNTLKRTYTIPGVQYKGKGFYVTDNAGSKQE